MADSPGNAEISRLLKTASYGHLHCFKQCVNELDMGDDLKQMLETIKDKNGRTALHHAALGGNTDVCRYLLDEIKIDLINSKDESEGETPLHQAITEGHYTTAVYFLEKGANPNVANDVGDTPLHFAVMKGIKNLVHLLISKGAHVDQNSDYGTPLHRAATCRNKKAMKVLLDNNANPNMILLRVYSPLIESIASGSLECVKLLLQGGADPNMVSGGMTPLHSAVAEGADPKIIKCLLDANANPDSVDCCGLTPLEVASHRGNHEAGMILLPLTTPFPSIPDWSYEGIVNFHPSDEALKQCYNKGMELFQLLKSKGEDEFKRGEYTNAIYWYTECYNINRFDAPNYSNLSACWARLNNGDEALTCAKKCVSLQPNWPKAHYREGVAWKLLKRFDKAATSFKVGLSLDPQNKEIRAAYSEALSKLKVAPSATRKAVK
ncbi:ankyrin repeat family protein [Euphorbia peplus]|nr:ankyrin repeat family protein [Euphorbia peplus]